MNDIAALKENIDLTEIVEQALGPGKKTGRALMFMCPFHEDHKTPSLSVKKEFFHCFGCGEGGDVFTWLDKYQGMSFKDALQFLGCDTSIRITRREPRPPEPRQAPAADWQQLAAEVTRICKEQLWSPVGDKAREWLNQRGLKDSTLRVWDIGYSPGMKICNTSIERGIIIPGYDMKRYWYIKIRRPAGEPKYRKLRGSTNGIFGQPPDLFWSDDIFITEGEFDCMLLWQECLDFTNIVTFGSASDRIDPNTWGGCLSSFDKIFLAYDIDQAGARGAQDLIRKTGRAFSCKLPMVGDTQPKDITDYYLAGGDLKAWAWYQIKGGAR